MFLLCEGLFLLLSLLKYRKRFSHYITVKGIYALTAEELYVMIEIMDLYDSYEPDFPDFDC